MLFIVAGVLIGILVLVFGGVLLFTAAQVHVQREKARERRERSGHRDHAVRGHESLEHDDGAGVPGRRHRRRSSSYGPEDDD